MLCNFIISSSAEGLSGIDISCWKDAKQALLGECEQTISTHLDCGMNSLRHLILQLISSLLRFRQQEWVGQGSVFGLHNLPGEKRKQKQLEDTATQQDNIKN